ncbi:MAG: GNAT family N-acetyltransferase [Eubacteriales bacterium]|nr:GNAT family N-acetyltransferase [Eubacteriales bacterium]
MVRKAGREDIKILTELAALLWESHTKTELEDELSELMEKESVQFFIADENNIPVGFAQCQLRYDYVEGTTTTPVGYLEGIFVREKYRGQSYARTLLTECESWAREKGCQEFASDCEMENAVSFQFHRAMGFAEANRIICFTKKLM